MIPNEVFLGHSTHFGVKIVVGLDIVFQATNFNIVQVASRPHPPNKVPGTDVSIFIPVGVIPCIEVGVSCCFSKFVSKNIDD